MQILKFYANAARGDVKLWQAFVFCYILLMIPVTIAANIAKEISFNDGHSNVAFLIFSLGVLYYIWVGVVIWRCSKNASKPIFGILAKLFSILILFQAGGTLKLLTVI